MTLGIDDAFKELNRLGPLSPAAAAAFKEIVATRIFDAGEWLLRAGARAELAFFITNGLVREFYIGPDGEEHTRVFMPERTFTGSLVDLLSGEPSITWIQAIERTESLAFRYNDFNQLCREHPTLQLVARRFAEELYVRKIRREHELLTLSARQRFERWRTVGRAIDSRIRRKDQRMVALGHPRGRGIQRPHAKSKRSRFMTLVHAAPKSFANFSLESEHA
jgi:CRP-like cAMP-binding protein